MAERKTQPTDVSVDKFLAGVKNERRRGDSQVVLKLMKKVCGKPPKMWGPSIIGFDVHRYQLANDKEAEICRIGFSPRSQALAFYLSNYEGRDEALQRLGKYKQGIGGCLYINKLDDVDLAVLEEIISGAYHQKSGTVCH
jgi:hypothetical protein